MQSDGYSDATQLMSTNEPMARSLATSVIGDFSDSGHSGVVSSQSVSGY